MRITSGTLQLRLNVPCPCRRNSGNAGRHLAGTLGKRLQLVVTLRLSLCQGEKLFDPSGKGAGEILRLHSKSRTVDVVVPFLKLVQNGKCVAELSVQVLLADIQHRTPLFQLLSPGSLYPYNIKQQNVVQHKRRYAQQEELEYVFIEFRQ